MKVRVNKRFGLIGIFGVVAISAALALGPLDDDDMKVDAAIPNLVQISGADDIDLGIWSGTGGLSAADDVCVWSSTRGYNITATGDGPGGQFSLTDGRNDLVYSVTWDDIDTTGQGLSAGVALAGQTTDAVEVFCRTGDTARIEIALSESALAGAPAGSYSGILTLAVGVE